MHPEYLNKVYDFFPVKCRLICLCRIKRGVLSKYVEERCFSLNQTASESGCSHYFAILMFGKEVSIRLMCLRRRIYIGAYVLRMHVATLYRSCVSIGT